MITIYTQYFLIGTPLKFPSLQIKRKFVQYCKIKKKYRSFLPEVEEDDRGREGAGDVPCEGDGAAGDHEGSGAEPLEGVARDEAEDQDGEVQDGTDEG